MSFAACGEARDMKFATTQEAEVYKSLRPAAATLSVSAFLPLSLAVGHGRFPTLADGAFQVLGLFKSSDD